MGSGGVIPRIHFFSTKWLVVSVTPRPLYLEERVLGYHWIVGWWAP
jgi:hypothetical protein